MVDSLFFSEKEGGTLLQVSDELGEFAWGGIVSLIESQLANQSFALQNRGSNAELIRGRSA